MEERGEESEVARAPSSCLHRYAIVPLLLFIIPLGFAAGTALSAYIRALTFSPPASKSSGSSVSRAFFVFGDSYADVGNIPWGSARSFPYGMTWPGSPAGRFSNGRVQSDCLATQALGLPSPSAFAESNVTTIPQGINFAVGGAGMTYAYGAPSIGDQVGWFEKFISSGIYSKDFLASSVTLLCISGNDYGSYRGSLENFERLIDEVAGLIELVLRRLHGLGLRNIMVTTVGPLNCLPESTSLTNYTTCNSNATVEALVVRHDWLLETLLANLSNELPGFNFVLLRQDAALKYIQNNAMSYNISEAFKPCCFGPCGQVDSLGNPLYTLCTNPEDHALWDDVHPTQAAWENVVDLYINGEGFTGFSPTLLHWSRKL